LGAGRGIGGRDGCISKGQEERTVSRSAGTAVVSRRKGIEDQRGRLGS
jgi:hypothetical protein